MPKNAVISLLLMTIFSGSLMLINPQAYLALAVLIPIGLLFIKWDYINSICLVILLLASIEQVPDKMSVQTVVFCLAFIAVFVMFPFKQVKQARLGELGGQQKAVLAFIIIVLANVAVAVTNASHPVSLPEWVRGAAPFLFLAISFPVFYIIKDKLDVLKITFAVLLSSSLYALNSLYIAVLNRIWELKAWVDVGNGQWVKATEADIMSGNVQYFAERITVIFPKSTNEIFLLGFFISVLLFVHCKNYLIRLTAVATWLLVTFNLVITYNKSFHIIVVGGLVFLAFLALCLKNYKKAVIYGIILLSTLTYTLGMVEALNLVALKNRYIVLYQSVESINGFEDGSARNKDLPMATRVVDTNVMARMDEIIIAFDMFREKPLIGQGLGVKHEIIYDVGFGRNAVFRKGYIHNSIFYFLMTTGLVGAVSYCLIYFFTLFAQVKLIWEEDMGAVIVLISLLCLFIYSQVFAVFRLIDFNLLLGVIVGITGALCKMRKREAA